MNTVKPSELRTELVIEILKRGAPDYIRMWEAGSVDYSRVSSWKLAQLKMQVVMSEIRHYNVQQLFGRIHGIDLTS